MPKVTTGIDRAATVTVLKAIREEARLSRRELSRKLHQRENFISVVEQGTREISVPELRPYALACGRDPLEVYAMILREIALHTTERQAAVTAKLNTRRKIGAKKRS